MSCVRVLCPSKGRADHVLTLTPLPFAELVVPEDEADEYREHNPDAEVVAHPDSVRSLAEARQWIIDSFGDEPMLQVDDDIQSMRRCYVERGEQYAVTDPDVAHDLILQVQSAAEQAGIYLWGFGKTANPAAYRPTHPFRITGLVQGNSLGINPGHRLWLPPDVTFGDDYWLSGLNAYHHRLVLVDERFCLVQADTFKGKGGLGAERTIEDERQATIRLRSAFGDAIARKEDTNLATVGRRYQRTLKVPW